MARNVVFCDARMWENFFSVSINVSRSELIKLTTRVLMIETKVSTIILIAVILTAIMVNITMKYLNGIHFSFWEGQVDSKVRAIEVFAMITYPNKPIPWLFSSFHQAYRTPPPEPQDLCQRYRAKWLLPLLDRCPLLQCWLSFPVRRESLTHESLLIGEGLS